MTVVWTEVAIRHLESVWDYLSVESRSVAESPLARILDAVENLGRYPELGRRGRIAHTRELVIPDTPFLIAYRIRNGIVEILAVLHGARRWPDRL